MADSVREQIMDAVVTALKTISRINGYETDVKLVSEQWKGYQNTLPKDIPSVYPIDTDETKEPGAVGIGAANDTQAVLTVVCTCIVTAQHNATRIKRTNLIRDVEKALVNDTSLLGLVEWIEPTTIVTDGGTIVDISIWDQTFELTYIYNSTAGG